MIDQNNFKVTDEQYNRVVNDAKNYNWDSQMKSAGTQAGRSHEDFDSSGMYDARVGGSMASQGNTNMDTANKYGDWTNSEYMSDASVAARANQASGAVRPEDVKPITANQDPASSGGSVDSGTNSNSAQNFTSNFFKGFNPSYKTSYKAPSMNDISGMYEKMGFNLDPNRFNTQGQ